MKELRNERAGPGGIVVWLATLLGLCLALTVGVVAELEAQEYDCLACHVSKDSKPVCALQKGDPLCWEQTTTTCGTFGAAWAILTGDIEACESTTQYWYWN